MLFRSREADPQALARARARRPGREAPLPPVRSGAGANLTCGEQLGESLAAEQCPGGLMVLTGANQQGLVFNQETLISGLAVSQMPVIAQLNVAIATGNPAQTGLQSRNRGFSAGLECPPFGIGNSRYRHWTCPQRNVSR